MDHFLYMTRGRYDMLMQWSMASYKTYNWDNRREQHIVQVVCVWLRRTLRRYSFPLVHCVRIHLPTSAETLSLLPLPPWPLLSRRIREHGRLSWCVRPSSRLKAALLLLLLKLRRQDGLSSQSLVITKPAGDLMLAIYHWISKAAHLQEENDDEHGHDDNTGSDGDADD